MAQRKPEQRVVVETPKPPEPPPPTTVRTLRGTREGSVLIHIPTPPHTTLTGLSSQAPKE